MSQQSVTGSPVGSVRQEEALSYNSTEGRFEQLQIRQRAFEQRIEQRFDEQFQALSRLITANNQPKPVEPSNNIRPPETPALTSKKAERRNSIDTRKSLNDVRRFDQPSATKFPQTASGESGFSPSNRRIGDDRVNNYPSMTIQHPEQFKLQSPIARITLQSIRNLENEISVYRQKPQNVNQQIYLFTDQFLTTPAQHYLVNQIHERNTSLKVPATHEWKTFNHVTIINYMKSVLQPRNSKEAEMQLAALIAESLAEPGNKIQTFAWHCIASWANKIFRAFEYAEYYLDEVYDEGQEHSAQMKPNKSLDLEGLSTLVPNILYPKLIATQMNRIYFRDKYLLPPEKGFPTFREYMSATRNLLRDLIDRFSTDQELIRAIHQQENKIKAEHQIHALCNRSESFLDGHQALQIGQALLNLEDFSLDDRTDLTSELSAKTSEMDDLDNVHLAALAEKDIDIDNLVCFRSINGNRCIQNNCKFSHRLEDIALYHRVKGKQAEAKLRQAKESVANLELQLCNLASSTSQINHSVPNTLAGAPAQLAIGNTPTEH